MQKDGQINGIHNVKLNDVKKLIFGALLGNIMEFYDFIIYAYFSTQIAKQFFSSKEVFISSLLALMVFASGYLTRPIGAIYFGNLGDKKGRKKALVYSIILITASTAAIGLLPCYNDIGYLAPIFLVACRLLQGFAVSGEQSGAAVYLSESVSPKQHGLIGGLVLGSSYFGVLLGSLICLVVTLFFPNDSFQNAWRIPFLLSIPLGLLSLKIRLKAADSLEFNLMKQKSLLRKSPIQYLFKNNLTLLLKMIFLTGSLSVPIYLYVIYLPNYLVTTAQFSQKLSLLLSCISLVFISILVPLIGKISDKLGYDKTLKFGYTSSIILSVPCFYILQLHSVETLLIMQLVMGIVIAFIAAPMFAIFIRSFPSDIRFSGVSFSFNVGMSIFGGTAPMIATLLIGVFKNNVLPGFYIMISSIMGYCILSSLSKNINMKKYSEIENFGEKLEY